MRLTAVLCQGEKRRTFKSLALSVYFKHPDFGMKEYEILSRASAFLLGIDPPDLLEAATEENNKKKNPFGHLEAAEQRRQVREYKRQHKYSPPGGPPGGRLMDMGWLEFVPKEVRPQVHIVASSHVLSPFLWKDYYPQDWLSKVRQEHCRYTLEVFQHEQQQTDAATARQQQLSLNEATKTTSLVKLALNSEPYHHPEGRDVGLVHFQEEESSLKILKSLGVKILHLRDADKIYEKGEDVFYDGYVVTEVDMPSSSSKDASKEGDSDLEDDSDEDSDDEQDDVRIFQEYKDQGQLTFHTNDRFFATSSKGPLPEGVCGAPVLDKDDGVCGVVEGYVPLNHKDPRLAGCAAFLPSYAMTTFVDFVERQMLQQIMPPDLFQMVVTAKKTNSIGGGVFKAPDSGSGDGPFSGESADWDEAYETILANLKKRHSKEEVDAILQVVKDEREQVMEIMNKEGGDLDEIMARVRARTLKIREMVHDEYRKSLQQEQEQKQHQQDETDRPEPLDEEKKA